MSDARMLAARQKMEAGDFQEAMALLKGMLAEHPEDAEVRQALMELQEQMMLDMQLQEKLKRVRALSAGGDTAGARKLLDEVLKVSPKHRDALALEVGLGGAVQMGTPDFGEFPAPPSEAGAATPGEFDFEELPAVPEAAIQGAPALEGEQTEFDFGEIPPVSLPSPPAAESTHSAGGAAGVPKLSPQEAAKVAQYVAEGKALQSQGRTQEAIDVWTRVFILDEENTEVQTLIDGARASLNANQGELEYTLNEGIAAFNAGDYPRAKPLLEKILQASPGHREAQYYLSRIPEGSQAPASAAAPDFELEGDFKAPAPVAPRPAASPRPAPAAHAAPANEGFELETGAADDFGVPAAAPPAPPSWASAPPPPAEPRPAAPVSVGRTAPRSAKKGPSLGIILGGVAALVLIGVGLLFIPKLLGGGTPPPPKAIPVRPSPPKTTTPNNPVQPDPAEPPAPQGKDQLLQAAKTAMGAKQYQKAVDYYRQVLNLEALNAEAQTGIESARAAYQVQLEEEARNAKFIKDYQTSVRSYRDGDYAESLRLAWRLIYPDDTLAKQLGKANSVRALLRNGYYNWAVRDLKSENPRGAEKNLKDLLDADKNDPEARKLLDFARKYINRPVDASYRDTVSALTYRPFEEVP